ncbi:MAG: PaaI family thioesterase [Actinobacteria bacterium]|nr:PaaI family thioesterase [Actinomycetota bacterium]
MRKTWRADEFDLLSPSVMRRWSSFLKEEGDRRWFPNLLGIEVEELRRDYARLRMPWSNDLNQSGGLMHGGAIATLIDTAVVPAIGTAYPDDRPFSTIEMSVRYTQPVRKEDLVAEGWVLRRGKRVVFCEVEVRTAAGVTVATGDLIYVVGSPPAPAS